MMTGSNNILIGLRAGANITSGSNNIGIGTDALSDVTTESGIIEINGIRINDPQLAGELAPALRDFIRQQKKEVGSV
jgi:hypothetical protein